MSKTLTHRALISVSDKTGLVDLGKRLIGHEVEILSTGGSAQVLRESGVVVKDVSSHTGFPEIMGGRVKTLHPKIHGGLLGRKGHHEDEQQMIEEGIEFIDILVVNLYPFERTVASGENYNNCVENIDIGGPAMIRAAAKNHQRVTVIVEPEDYPLLLDELDHNDGVTTLGFRKSMAAKAYRRTGAYDAAIGAWYSDILKNEYPERLVLFGSLKQELRYGENPHQTAAFYTNQDGRPGIGTAKQLQGKELSFNNLNDTDAAFELVAEFDDVACAIIKHANPCGVAIASNLAEAYLKALACDPESAYGGIIACNRPLDAETAEHITKLFAEVVIAPGVKEEARDIIATKENLRVLVTEGLPDREANRFSIRTLASGFLLQSRDSGLIDGELKVVTRRRPSKQELDDLVFAFTVCKHVKSNAIVYAKDGVTVGIGAGQMSRINSSRIASWKAADAAKASGESKTRTRGSVVASDAFFPFADGLLSAVEAGATAVIQPGGSIRDNEVISAADEAGLTMVFTAMRHFRH